MEKDSFRVLDRELADRKFDGISVTLMWIPGTDKTYVTVHDSKENEFFVVNVPHPERAWEVFEHPYAFRAINQLVSTQVEHGLGTE